MFCYFCFFNGALNYVDIYFEVMFMQLSALRKLIFGVHSVQEMFFRLAKKFDQKFEF